jgi:hypothetical protein
MLPNKFKKRRREAKNSCKLFWQTSTTAKLIFAYKVKVSKNKIKTYCSQPKSQNLFFADGENRVQNYFYPPKIVFK